MQILKSKNEFKIQLLLIRNGLSNRGVLEMDGIYLAYEPHEREKAEEEIVRLAAKRNGIQLKENKTQKKGSLLSV